ncbi:hypothetical protein FB45DRAFT_1024174 [Roridomyces roridus]|uniref:F-box domain-containing protein n=1 Tax=Roridomyces roridus TaxID=1738132 RepID=A0AAD7C604_9AGAR|nr:hypothetical protein FB45DRAFT_1024174 [Roridomyces roridus]
MDSQTQQTEQTEQAPHQKRLDEHKYPVLSLPNEIVSEIFIQCLPPYPACPPVRGPSSPTCLTHICRKWRDIALTTPQLWRAIPFRAAGNPHVQAWLERSRSCPLSIFWDESNVFGHWPPPKSLKTIIRHHERWEYANLTIDWMSGQPFLLEGPMPLLSELFLRMDDVDRFAQPRVKTRDFPKLRTLSLLHCSVHLGDWLPWAQLTSLTLSDVNPTYNPRYATCTSILQRAVNLIHLKIINCTVNQHEQLTLPHLESLMMFSQSRFCQNLDILPIDTFAAFISRSGCRLQKVLITGGGIHQTSKAAFRNHFAEIPQITFNSQYNWFSRWDGDEEDSGDDSG